MQCMNVSMLVLWFVKEYLMLEKCQEIKLTGSFNLSGMLSIDILDPGRDSDSRSSLDLRKVSYIALVDGVLFPMSCNFWRVIDCFQ